MGKIMRVGKIIKQERLKRGWSQADLGRLVHISKTAVSRWESGEREPGLDALSQIAVVMELGIDALLDPRQHSLFRPESIDASRTKASAIDPLLEAAWQRLSPRERRKLVQIALILSEK
jgi:transcriptional regulator with XRE-family HTH domain